MEDRQPTVRSRELGDRLRAAMQYAGFNAAEIARQLDWSPSRVSRLLSGKRGGNVHDVTAVMAVCGVRGPEREKILALARSQDRTGWFQQHGPVLPKQVRTLIDHETQSEEISSFHNMAVDGLLQTPDYARAVISHCVNVPPDEVEDRVQARLARQALLSRDYPRPPHCTFFLHEFALRTPIGGPEVMSEQLHHLLRMAVRSNITIRVLPANIGAHAALSGPFTLLDVLDFKPIVYLDSETSCLFLEMPIEIAAYRKILAVLADTALHEGQSRDFIAALATELYPQGDANHDEPG